MYRSVLQTGKQEIKSMTETEYQPYSAWAFSEFLGLGRGGGIVMKLGG